MNVFTPPSRRSFMIPAILVLAFSGMLKAQIPNVEWKSDEKPAAPSAIAKMIKEKITKGPFQPNWPSLEKYECPAWFRDAKFGIFMHWSVNSVVPGGNDGWYGRQMYMQKGAPWGNAYAYHVKTYGPPSEFGYKDLIPLWKAENFDPAELVALYKKAGARYIVPVAVHHDNFDNYASTYQPWNSVNLGPKRDLIGEWEKATRAAGLKFGASSHSDRSRGWFEFSRKSDIEGPLAGVPYDGVQTKADGKGKWWEGYDPTELYGPTTEEGSSEPGEPENTDRWKATWLNRTLELVNKYQLDLLYFDSGMPMGDLGLDVAASLYNNHIKNGKTESVLALKWNPRRNACVEDLEKGLSNFIRPQPWQLDASINNMWFTDEMPLVLSTAQIIHTLTDSVSKNGNLLLNVALHADGTTDPEERKRLLEVGDWLAINGEAIYGTRPTHLAGEGPTAIRNWLPVDQNLPAFTPQDIRFTTKGDDLYAIVMRLPASEIKVTALRSGGGVFDGQIRDVKILGVAQKIQWKQDATGLHATVPDSIAKDSTSDLGVVLKVSGLRNLQRDGTVRPLADGTMQLNCWDAKITGKKLAPMDFEPALVNWNDPQEYPSWDFVCPAPGEYLVQAKYCSPKGDAEAVVKTPGSDLTWAIKQTKNDKDFRLADIGTIRIAKAGRYSLSVKPDSKQWNQVDLSFVQLKDPVLRGDEDGRVELNIFDAVLNGNIFFLEKKGGVTNVGGWKSAEESVTWENVQFPRPGKYAVKILGAAGDGDSAFKVKIGETEFEGRADKTESFDLADEIPVGEVTIPKAGIYPVTLTPNPGGWNAINLASLIFQRVP